MEYGGITPVGRIYAFKDPLAASVHLESAVHYQETEWAWLDNSAAMGGKAWLNPVNEYAKVISLISLLNRLARGLKG